MLASAATVEDARHFADGIAQEALGVIKSVPDKQQKQQKLEHMFAQHVDIPWIGKFVLGRYWRQANPDQQSRYLSNYQDFLLTHYTSHLTDYSNGSYQIVNAKTDAENEFTVSMKIQPPNAQAISVDYRLRMNDAGEMKVFDIIIEGVSLITTQRSEFTSVVQNQGMDALIAQLAQKTKEARQS